jgi:hypothetical protein
MRRLGLRVLVAAFAVSWLVLPGFGAIDLSVTWSSSWPEVLEAGWGLFFTLLVAGPFVFVAASPSAAARPAIAQLTVAVLSLAVSAAAAREARLGLFAATLAVETAIAAAVVRRPIEPSRTAVSRPLSILASLGVVPWSIYGWHMWGLDRENRADSDLTLGIDHYSVQGAVGFALALLPALAAARRELRPFVAMSAGLVAAYLGIVSAAWSDAAGALGSVWSIAAIAWGVGLLASAWTPRAVTT